MGFGMRECGCNSHRATCTRWMRITITKQNIQVPGHRFPRPGDLQEPHPCCQQGVLDHSHLFPPVILIISRDFIWMWSESRDCHQHQKPGAGVGAALYSCSGPVPAFLKLINSIASLFPWEKWSADSGPHWFPRTPDATLGLYFYFQSGLLTRLRSVNQLAKCFAAAVLSVILHAIVFPFYLTRRISLRVQTHPLLWVGEIVWTLTSKIVFFLKPCKCTDLVPLRLD